MVRASPALLLREGGNICKALSDFLVCPLSKQPLRRCQDSQSLISDTIGVSFPDGKLLEDQDISRVENGAHSSVVHSER
ncbi:protein preY, mitochondrial isoform X2 [Phoenix dactylifera]|uniref:Protein preY, mitochondrial n=1 Tax=Phoenix dactylifera TaxID=42345 RepID=A0A8B8JB51_PHODC|nr:protein preY, mitochondrial isoform X2 [Phoenix dactylifera]